MGEKSEISAVILKALLMPAAPRRMRVRPSIDKEFAAPARDADFWLDLEDFLAQRPHVRRWLNGESRTASGVSAADVRALRKWMEGYVTW